MKRIIWRTLCVANLILASVSFILLGIFSSCFGPCEATGLSLDLFVLGLVLAFATALPAFDCE